MLYGRTSSAFFHLLNNFTYLCASNNSHLVHITIELIGRCHNEIGVKDDLGKR